MQWHIYPWDAEDIYACTAIANAQVGSQAAQQLPRLPPHAPGGHFQAQDWELG